MLDDPYGKKDWAKTTTSPLFTFWKLTLIAYGPDFGGEAFVAATERLAKNCAECEPFFMCLATIMTITNAVDQHHLALCINIFTMSISIVMLSSITTIIIVMIIVVIHISEIP